MGLLSLDVFLDVCRSMNAFRIGLIVLASIVSVFAQPKSSASLRLNVPVQVKKHFLKKELSSHVVVDPDYFTWGMSVIRWSDGKYHGYYSRWPRKTQISGWMTDCEIVHSVSDKPEGPFRFVNVVVKSRNAKGWDVIGAHNPNVCVENGKIHLYFISNRLRDDYKATPEKPFPSRQWLKKNRRDIVRNRQSVAVATAISPSGPFVRASKPVVIPDGKLFKNIAVNPAVIYKDGKFIMIVKGDDVLKKKWFRIQLVGHSDKAEGPFVFQEKPIYSKAQTEDACLWYDQTQKRFHSLFHVMGKPYLAHLISDDSYVWHEAKPFFMIKKEFVLSDGTIWKPGRVERPFVLTSEKGRAKWIYCGVAEGNTWGNIASPWPVRESSAQ